jgi:hypothetical protein
MLAVPLDGLARNQDSSMFVQIQVGSSASTLSVAPLPDHWGKLTVEDP